MTPSWNRVTEISILDKSAYETLIGNRQLADKPTTGNDWRRARKISVKRLRDLVKDENKIIR